MIPGTCEVERFDHDAHAPLLHDAAFDERPRESFARARHYVNTLKWAAQVEDTRLPMLVRQLAFRRLATQSKLTNAEFRFLIAVLDHADRNFTAFPSLLTLGFECGREKRARAKRVRAGFVKNNERRLKALRARLAEAKWLTWTHAGGRTTYMLHLPPDVAKPGHQGWSPRAAR